MWKVVLDFLDSRRFANNIIYLSDFSSYISVDKVLIALELDRAVSADGLVVVAAD